MPPKEPREPSRAAVNSGLTYVAQKPSFLANFGKAALPEEGKGRDGRDLPSRPKEGEWAAGSDGEEEDEWDAMYGGGEEGPQVVVLKEGRHLSADEVARERRRAKGEPSPPPEKERGDDGETKEEAVDGEQGKEKTVFKSGRPGAKRKLVGEAVAKPDGDGKSAAPKTKKKKKADKKLLSFDEEEGE